MISRQQVSFPAWFARRSTNDVAQTERSEPADGGVGAEAPIQTASGDRLRRSDFADRIADVLSERSLREGRVFAIRGGWGFGKTSFKNLIAEKLDAKDRRADWLDFNPWQWGDSDAIVRALFGQIADRLGGDHSKAALKRAKALRRYGEILAGAGAPLKEAAGKSSLLLMVLTNASVLALASFVGLKLPTVATIAAVLAVLSVGFPIVGRVLTFLGKDFSNDPLDKVRSDLEVRLRELDRPLIVFVDDIDRLEPEQIRMLLRHVKANANLPNIVFVLLFQPSIVEKALESVAGGDGRAFLEKIVQASFDLPAVPVSVVHRIFWEELWAVVSPYATEANGFSKTYAGNALVGCIQPMLRNLRDARRLISSIAVHLPLHASEGLFEVNIVDFLVLETLRVFEPNLHDALFRERDLILQVRRSRDNVRRDEDKEAAECLRDIAPKERRAIVQDTLKFLFPTIEWAYGGTNYSGGSDAWLAAKRVCTPRFFPSYFELQTPAGEVSERRFVAFLDAAVSDIDLSAAIADIETDELLASLATRLSESVERLPVEHAAVLLPAMFLIAQKLAVLGDANPLDSPYLSSWQATSWFLQRIPKPDRGDLALNALRKSKALLPAAILIHLSDPNDRRERGEPWNPTLDMDTIEAMKHEWLRQIRALASEDSALSNEPDLPALLYRWRDYSGGIEEPREWVMAAIQDDKGFARISASLMSQANSHSAGDRVSTSHYKFDRKTIEDFIGISQARAKCDAIDPADFPAEAIAIRTLARSVEIWAESETHDPLDY